MNGAEFKARVTGHLATALALVPDVVPVDVFDDRVDPLMRELQDLDELLYGLGRDERSMESQESTRERQLSAKAAAPFIERTVERLDERIQKLVEVVGMEPTQARLIGPMYADLVIGAMLRLMDLVPPSVFAEDRTVPATFPSRTDATVSAIVILMRERHAQAGGR